MGQEDLAAGKKNATRLKAHIVFIDETGLLMAPLVRRTWSPRGVTPVLYQQGRSREKITMVGALSVSPQRKHIGLYYLTVRRSPTPPIVTQDIFSGLRSQAGIL